MKRSYVTYDKSGRAYCFHYKWLAFIIGMIEGTFLDECKGKTYHNIYDFRRELSQEEKK